MSSHNAPNRDSWEDADMDGIDPSGLAQEMYNYMDTALQAADAHNEIARADSQRQFVSKDAAARPIEEEKIEAVRRMRREFSSRFPMRDGLIPWTGRTLVQDARILLQIFEQMRRVVEDMFQGLNIQDEYQTIETRIAAVRASIEERFGSV